MKIGFIGLGHMGKAIVSGLIKAKVVAPSDILVHSAHRNNYEAYAKQFGLVAVASNNEVAQQADLIILAIKPSLKETIFSEINKTLAATKTPLLSLLTGVDLKTLAALTVADVPIVRIMPNLNVQINQGITALAGNENAQKKLLPMTKQLFDHLGTTLPLPEADFSTFVALAGSAPAFVYLFIDALAHAGVKYGLTKEQAVQIVSQMVAGSAALVQQSEQHPWALIDAVASPGGSTIAGVLALQAAGFESGLAKAVDATISKDLGK